ncbi:hypothetical protein A2V82_09475, partial [candidate division KSB1 bacterium RBG_16_48_16]
MDSKVEKFFIDKKRSVKIDKKYEKIPVLTVDNYVVLGQLTAIRFLEWVCENPGGVIGLPTGKTPEFFIKWVQYYLANWQREAQSGLLSEIGFHPDIKPEMKSLHFIQLDEFFPLNPQHERSFHYFVKKYYINGFGLDARKAQLIDTYNVDKDRKKIIGDIDNIEQVFPDGIIDLALRIKHPSNSIEILQKKTIKYFDQFCAEYEERIRTLGGIGFFLGGIGPDGHIAFNVQGSSHRSTTRLTPLNYETQAAAAIDLGGIESVRKKAVITIGLETITANPDCVAIIIAAGQAKAKVVADAIENDPSLEFPASSLQKLPNARFYLTDGAASQLKERKHQALLSMPSIPGPQIEQLVIEGAINASIKLMEIINQPEKLKEKKPQEWALAEKLSGQSIPALAQNTYHQIETKIEGGLSLPKNQRFLHTAPHHDDIELAYFPLLHHLVRSEHNENYFVYCTSGFTAVTNDYVLSCLTFLHRLVADGLMQKRIDMNTLKDMQSAQDDIVGALNSIAAQNDDQNLYIACRLARQIFHSSANPSDEALLTFVQQQIIILNQLTPGRIEPEIIKIIKGWIREFEAELVWGHFGIRTDHVYHLRLKFYTGDIFPKYPNYEEDVLPIYQLLEKIQPTIISVALDPEGSGPDTHYKTLIAVSAAIDQYVDKHPDMNIRLWGYRNVWTRFLPSEVNMIVPVSLNSFAVLHQMFNHCFISQKSASFPSYELDGTFSQLAQ